MTFCCFNVNGYFVNLFSLFMKLRWWHSMRRAEPKSRSKRSEKATREMNQGFLRKGIIWMVYKQRPRRNFDRIRGFYVRFSWGGYYALCQVGNRHVYPYFCKRSRYWFRQHIPISPSEMHYQDFIDLPESESDNKDTVFAGWYWDENLTFPVIYELD